MPTNEDFAAIFKMLKAILKKYEKRSVVEKDTETEYYLNSKNLDEKNRPIFFAAASINKISVSFYLMPIYCCPVLFKEISPGLRKRLHGKSCFRFTKIEPALFKELAALVQKSVKLPAWRKLVD